MKIDGVNSKAIETKYKKKHEQKDKICTNKPQTPELPLRTQHECTSVPKLGPALWPNENSLNALSFSLSHFNGALQCSDSQTLSHTYHCAYIKRY